MSFKVNLTFKPQAIFRFRICHNISKALHFIEVIVYKAVGSSWFASYLFVLNPLVPIQLFNKGCVCSTMPVASLYRSLERQLGPPLPYLTPGTLTHPAGKVLHATSCPTDSVNRFICFDGRCLLLNKTYIYYIYMCGLQSQLHLNRQRTVYGVLVMKTLKVSF